MHRITPLQKASAAAITLCVSGVILFQFTPVMQNKDGTNQVRSHASEKESARILEHMKRAATHGLESEELEEALNHVGPWATTKQRPSDNLVPAKAPISTWSKRSEE